MDAKLDTESTSSKLAESIWDDPEWNENSGNADTCTVNESILKSG